MWLVEMLDVDAWRPTVGIALTRSEGRVALRHWRTRNSFDVFRLVRYYRERGK